MKNTVMKKIRLFIFPLIAFLFFFTLTSFVTATTASVGVKWPHEESDLSPDPALIFGKLPNGFRYVVMKNTYPKDRVSLHLDVEVGSLNESNDQAGVAHFLEHILFCGSTHFKPGELVKYFQRIGMDFGPDANARTGFNFTVYDLLLPNGDKKSLEDGLIVLRDYADGALILESEVNRERNVILAEKRKQDSSSYRTFVSAFKFEFPESLLSERIPIGTEAVIQKADRSLLKDFYDTWYRPENMILVMVGDVDTAQAVSLIEARFSDMAARAPKKPEPDIGKIGRDKTMAFYHHEKEAGETTLTIEIMKKVPRKPDSFEIQKALLVNSIANQIVQDRLNEMMSKPEPPLTSASISSGPYMPEIDYAELDVECNPENWSKSLQVMEKTLRKAVIYGFTQPELDKVKKDQISQMDKAVRTASTRESQAIARSILRSLIEGQVFQSPSQEKDLFVPFIEGLSLQTVNDAFKKTWGDPKLILVTGNVEIGPDPEKKILSVFDQSAQEKVFPPAAQAKVIFPYLSDPVAPGKILDKKEVPDLGIIQIDFANHIRLNIKKTDYKADEILMIAGFGSGESGEPEKKPGLSLLCPDVINESGLGKLKKEELGRALAGKNTTLSFGMGEERFFFQGTSSTGELQLLFQLLYAQIKDPAFREDVFRLSMERLDQKYKEMSHTVEGVMEISGEKFLSGGDSRFGYPPLETLNKYTVVDIESWVGEALKNGSMEVSIVGDLDVRGVEALAANYLGTLPERRITKDKEKASRQPKFPSGQSLHLKVPTQIPKGIVEVTYPTEDFWDIGRTRRFNVLSEVFSEKLRKRIREKLGASYSPYAYNYPHKAYPGYGVFYSVVTVDPKTSESVLTEVKKIGSNLSTSGITEEELKLALDPILTHIKDVVKTNGYWLGSVLTGSREHPEQIDWARNMIEDYTSISTQDVSALAKKYLNNGHAATIIIGPAETKEIN